MFDFLKGAGIFGVLILIVSLLVFPIAITFKVVIALANAFGLTGITWWAFVILFYLVIASLLNRCMDK